MKLLKIESNCGHFMAESGTYKAIDTIAKEDLLRMVKTVLDEDAEFDEFDEEKIKNQAHQVVYKSLYDNLVSLQQRKAEFVDESERMYLDDYKRYVENATQQDDSPDADGTGDL